MAAADGDDGHDAGGKRTDGGRPSLQHLFRAVVFVAQRHERSRHERIDAAGYFQAGDLRPRTDNKDEAAQCEGAADYDHAKRQQRASGEAPHCQGPEQIEVFFDGERPEMVIQANAARLYAREKVLVVEPKRTGFGRGQSEPREGRVRSRQYDRRNEKSGEGERENPQRTADVEIAKVSGRAFVIEEDAGNEEAR